ncbi:hypothetical protein BM526_02410 [Alteromonas mediterranea]|uniref:hypothetical protein n=1 Tax=Alteromonas mediterranea TaxID=314275 RepID=UPI00090372A2|nr:hypothetical protein [Alteromonas mediterranea]APE00809.1 hypothetical protein BM526_02410 [Alteromonas mediterranea]
MSRKDDLRTKLSQLRKLSDSGEHKEHSFNTEIAFLEDLLEKEDEQSLDAINDLIIHLPSEEHDPALIVLKGHLLIEKLVRRFISSRLVNPEPFEKSQINALSCITIAESMCLANEEPKWLWTQIKELNAVRNKLAHNLPNEKIEQRIHNFIATVSVRENLHSKTLTGCIARLYGMLKGLCEVAESSEFRLYKR